MTLPSCTPLPGPLWCPESHTALPASCPAACMLQLQLGAAQRRSGALSSLRGTFCSSRLPGSRPPTLLPVAHCVASSHQQVHWQICLLPSGYLQAISFACLQSADEQLCTAPTCTALPAATTDPAYLALHGLPLVSWWLGSGSPSIALHMQQQPARHTRIKSC